MKLGAGETQVIVGKRVVIGTAINSTAAGIATFYPDHAVALMSFSVPITFVVQVFIANKFGVTGGAS